MALSKKQPPKSPLLECARAEIEAWKPGFQPTVIAVLFAFIHRLTTGETIEETFSSLRPKDGDDYQI